jgi:RNA polymerase sigma-70 factor (ECF subfamily)
MQLNTEFIERLRRGDEKAYTELVSLYSKKLFAYAISLSGDYAMAKDVVQEVFISTYEYRKKLDNKYSIEGFLFRLTYNKFINSYHKNKSLHKLKEKYIATLNQIIGETQDPQDFNHKLALVQKSIDALPEKCRVIFTMSKKEGLTNTEISEVLQISVKTVEAQISIAFSKIRKDLRVGE